MNHRVIAFMIGRLLTAAGLTMALPIIVAIYYREPPAAFAAFLVPMALMAALGNALTKLPGEKTAYFARDGLVNHLTRPMWLRKLFLLHLRHFYLKN